MKLNEDGKTVRAMDILFPQIGEIIGGSERESDYLKLRQRMEELGMNMKQLWWYLETRKFGTVPHAGFGLGFERLVLFVTGMSNIRDVIPFPRTPKNANFKSFKFERCKNTSMKYYFALMKKWNCVVLMRMSIQKMHYI